MFKSLIAATALLLLAGTASAEVLGNVTLGRDGDAFNPGYTFSNEPALGLYRKSSGVMAVSAGKGLGVKEISGAVTPGSQAANTCAPQSFTVTGVIASDRVVLVLFPATGNATGYGAAAPSAANTVAQTVCNPTAGALTPAAGNFTYLIFPANP